MSDSILISIKKLLGISEEDTTFDADITMHINSVLGTLYQIGVGSAPLVITGSTETWSRYFGTRTDLEMIKSYIFMRVKLLFDPPPSESLIKSMNSMISEFEWRVNVTVDSGSTNNQE